MPCPVCGSTKFWSEFDGEIIEEKILSGDIEEDDEVVCETCGLEIDFETSYTNQKIIMDN